MNVEIDNSFEDDFRKLRDSTTQKRIIQKIEHIESVTYVSQISSVKKNEMISRFI